MHITPNIRNLPRSAIRSRLSLLGVEEIKILNVSDDNGQPITLIETQSDVDALTIDNALSTPVTAVETTAEQGRQIDIAQIRAEYLNMIARLEQIQAAVNPTNAQVIQAIKDEALYIERIMKVIKTIVT